MFSNTIRGHFGYDCQGKHVTGGLVCGIKNLRNQLAKTKTALAESNDLIEAMAMELPPGKVPEDENMVVRIKHIVEENAELQQ